MLLGIVAVGCAAPTVPTPAPAGVTAVSPLASLPPTHAPAALSLDASGLGPCDTSFPYSCAYMIRIDGPGGYEHYGWFVWGGSAEHAESSDRVAGDVPTTLPPGIWTLSFGFVHQSDLVSFVPVPGGTPRSFGLDPADVGCALRLVVADEISDRVHVAFARTGCTAAAETALP